MAHKLFGSIWLAEGQVLLSDHRDYVKILPVARGLDPKAKVRAVDEEEIPDDAELIAGPDIQLAI